MESAVWLGMASLTLQQVLAAGFLRLCATHGVRGAVYRWAHSVMACRTAALGGHVWRCPEGHEHRVVWNSCKHRACPQCAGVDRERWLEKMRRVLELKSSYHHVTFTVPEPLNEVWRWNRRWFADQVLGAARETLLQLLAQRRWLGAMPGLVLSWHTWGRNLSIHPHVHVLVTAGGWTGRGWRSLKRDYLIATRVLSQVFRGKLQARLLAGLQSGEMVLPDRHTEVSMRRLLQRQYRHSWVVDVQPRYRHGGGVLTYLGRYVRGGPLREHQLLSMTSTHVRFRHWSHKEGKVTSLPLRIEDFLHRLGEHVPDPGFVSVRYAGLYATTHRAELSAARQALGMSPEIEAPEKVSAQDYLEKTGHGDVLCCSVCGRRLEQKEKIERSDRAPPYERCRHAA